MTRGYCWERMWHLLLAMALTLCCTTGAKAEEVPNFEALHPKPQYSPEQVIRLQLEALKFNNRPYRNAGIDIAFRFSSEKNKLQTGPLERFRSMLRGPQYRAMINHKMALYGSLVREGVSAVQEVSLIASDGERADYLFVLRKETSGPNAGCWVNDGVLRASTQGKPRVDEYLI